MNDALPAKRASYVEVERLPAAQEERLAEGYGYVNRKSFFSTIVYVACIFVGLYLCWFPYL